MQFSALNIAWVVVNLIGVLASGRILHECYRDYRFIQQNRINSVRQAVARTSTFNELSRFVTLSFFLLLGILAILHPERWFTDEQHDTLYDQVLIGLFMLVAVILTITSLSENAARQWIIKRHESNV